MTSKTDIRLKDILHSDRIYPLRNGEKEIRSGQAEIFVSEFPDSSSKYIIKKYKQDKYFDESIFYKIKDLSEKIPEHVVRVFDCAEIEESAFDKIEGRSVNHDKARSGEKCWCELLEYARYGTLEGIFKQDAFSFNKIIDETNIALKAIHDNKIIHLDVKPQNILVRTMAPLDLVFTDFGIASVLSDEEEKIMANVCGTPAYMAPESLGMFGCGTSKEADYWALGMLILEKFDRLPFEKLGKPEIKSRLESDNIKIPEKVKDEYKYLIEGLLTISPEKRWGYQEVSSWLKGEIKSKTLIFIIDYYKKFEKPFESHQMNGNIKLFHSINDLVKHIRRDQKSWQYGIKYLQSDIKKSLVNWFTENNEHEINNIINDIKAKIKDPDLMLLSFIHRINSDLPFKFDGHYISVNNLNLLIGNKNNEIIEGIKSGRLKKLYSGYLSLAGKNMPRDLLYLLIEKIENIFKDEKTENKITNSNKLLSIICDINDYVFPHQVENKFKFILANYNIIIRRKYYEKYFLPDIIQSKENYLIIAKLIYDNKLDSLITKYEDERFRNQKPFISNTLLEKASQNFSDYNYLCRMIKGNMYIDANEITSLDDYYWPENVKVDLNSNFRAYEKALYLVRKRLLISKKLYFDINKFSNLPAEFKEFKDGISFGIYIKLAPKLIGLAAFENEQIIGKIKHAQNKEETPIIAEIESKPITEENRLTPSQINLLNIALTYNYDNFIFNAYIKHLENSSNNWKPIDEKILDSLNNKIFENLLNKIVKAIPFIIIPVIFILVSLFLSEGYFLPGIVAIFSSAASCYIFMRKKKIRLKKILAEIMNKFAYRFSEFEN